MIKEFPLYSQRTRPPTFQERRETVYAMIQHGQVTGVTRIGHRVLVRGVNGLDWPRQKSAVSKTLRTKHRMLETLLPLTIVWPTLATFAITGIVIDGTSKDVLHGIAVSAAGHTATTNSAGRTPLAGVSAGNVTVSASTSYQPASLSLALTADTRVDVAV